MSLANQIIEYLGKTTESNTFFNSMADPSQLRERMGEAKKLRSEIARHGGRIVLPLLEATEPIIKQRALLVRSPIAKLNPSGYETLAKQGIEAVLENATELVKEVGRDAENPLILALEHKSLYVRLQAAALLGLESVRSRASVQPLKNLLGKGNEPEAVEVVASATLLLNRDTDRGTKDELSRFLAYWVDNRASGEKQPGRSPDTLPALVHSLIPHILFLYTASEQ